MTSRTRKPAKSILDYGETLDIAKKEKDKNITKKLPKDKEPFLTNVETSFLALSVVGATGITTAVNISKKEKFSKGFRNTMVALIASLVGAVIIIFLLRIAFGKKTDQGVISFIKKDK